MWLLLGLCPGIIAGALIGTKIAAGAGIFALAGLGTLSLGVKGKVQQQQQRKGKHQNSLSDNYLSEEDVQNLKNSFDTLFRI